jgi:hypothetical protein
MSGPHRAAKWTPDHRCGATGRDPPDADVEPDEARRPGGQPENAQVANLFEFSIDGTAARRTVSAVPGDLTAYKRAALLKERLRGMTERAWSPSARPECRPSPRSSRTAARCPRCGAHR